MPTLINLLKDLFKAYSWKITHWKKPLFRGLFWVYFMINSNMLTAFDKGDPLHKDNESLFSSFYVEKHHF